MKPNKKELTRERVVSAAGRCFRQYGYDGIGVDGLAKAAEVTSGAFYAHLGSKQAAFLEALNNGLEEVIAAIPVFQKTFKAMWIKEFIDYYLSQKHQEDLACGCAMATLTLEAVRSNSQAHQLYETKMGTIAMLIGKGLAGSQVDDRETRAWALLSLLTGGLNIIRAMESPALKASLSESIKLAALAAAGKAKSIKS